MKRQTMARIVLIVACGVVLPTLAQTQQKASNSLRPQIQSTPPSTGMGLWVIVGNIASRDNKVEVGMLVLITADRQDATVSIKEDAILGAEIKVQAALLDDLVEATQLASDAASKRQKFNWAKDTITIQADNGGVGIHVKTGLISSQQIVFDADNALNLARLIRRSAENWKWLKPRMAALDLAAKLPITIKE